MEVITGLFDITQPEQKNETTQKTKSLFCIFVLCAMKR